MAQNGHDFEFTAKDGGRPGGLHHPLRQLRELHRPGQDVRERRNRRIGAPQLHDHRASRRLAPVPPRRHIPGETAVDPGHGRRGLRGAAGQYRTGSDYPRQNTTETETPTRGQPDRIETISDMLQIPWTASRERARTWTLGNRDDTPNSPRIRCKDQGGVTPQTWDDPGQRGQPPRPPSPRRPETASAATSPSGSPPSRTSRTRRTTTKTTST